MKKIIRGINTLIILVAAAATMYSQINLSGKKIHELPALPSNVVDTNYLFIIANPIDGKPYKFKKSTLLSGATGVVDGNYGDVTVSGVTWSINASSVQNSKLAAMANNTYKGNLSGGTLAPQDLTVGQMQSSLGINTKLEATDTASLSNRINSKMTAADTAYLSNRINNKQDLDADLTSISGASGTNTIYYRSAANTWSPVTIGGNMTFSGGTLNSTASGGGTWGSITGTIGNQTDLAYELSQKQAQLVSASNIKTINNISLLGSGNISVGGGGSQTLDQTLAVGNTTDTGIIFELDYSNTIATQSYIFDPAVPNGVDALKTIKRIRMSEWVNHADSLVGDWSENISETEVNSDGRKNVVWSWGYNIDQAKTNEAYLRIGMESHYIESVHALFEFHFPEVKTKDGDINRWYSITGRKDTASATHILRGTTFNFLDIQSDVQRFGFDGDNWGMKGNYITWTAPNTNTYITYNLSTADAIHNYVPSTGGNVFIGASGKWMYFSSPRVNYDGQIWTDKYFSVNSVANTSSFKIDNGSYATYLISANSDNSGVDVSMNGKMQIAALDNSTTSVFRIAADATRGYATIANFHSDGSYIIGGSTANASAIVDITSTTKGFLPPRMTKTQRDAISSPATGLVIYQTDNTPGLRCYNGTNWMRYSETAD